MTDTESHNSERPTAAEVQSAVLAILSEAKTDYPLQRPNQLREAVAERLKVHVRTSETMAAVWSMIGRGLVFIDTIQAHTVWPLRLSDTGQAAASDELTNPDNPHRYLEHLQSLVPLASRLVRLYLDEALDTYTSRNYLASTVMLGVASEAAFMELAEAFGKWAEPVKGRALADYFADCGHTYYQKYKHFRKHYDLMSELIPEELRDGVEIALDAVANLIRRYRNEAGHPTGKTFDHKEARMNLWVAPPYLQRVYELKDYFDSVPLQQP